MNHQIRSIGLATCVASCVLSVGIIPATAGSFGVNEHSASAQGASYAGVAAGGQLSSLFWNPAIMTQFSGMSFEISASGFFGEGKNNVTSVTPAGLGLIPYTPNDFLNDALIPAIYASWQLSPQLWVGLSINAPFGLSVSFPDAWPGRNYAQSTALKTYNAAPTVAYRINDWLSVGVGLQIQYGSASLSNGLTFGVPFTSSLMLEGHGWGIGATAGLTLTPGPNTTVGIGWRSAVDQKISGNLVTPAVLGGTPGPASTTIKLPDIVTLGVRQRMNAQWTVMGTVEWSNWSRIGTSRVIQGNGAAAIAAGGVPLIFPFQYRDGWLFSGGFEYGWRPDTTLRAGLGYEISPVYDAVRTPRIPDANRVWLSGGLTHTLLKNLKLDLAYSHLFVDKAAIAVQPGNPWFTGVTYIGTATGSIDIISVGLKYQFEPPASLPLIRKG